MKKLVTDMSLNKQILQGIPDPMLTHVCWSKKALRPAQLKELTTGLLDSCRVSITKL